MRSFLQHAVRIILVGLLALGCADLRDLADLASALHEQFSVTPNVRLVNRSHLAITLQNDSTLAKLDSAGLAKYAHDIAAFSRAHYPHVAALEDISVTFATVSTFGPMTTTRTGAPYVYPVSALQ